MPHKTRSPRLDPVILLYLVHRPMERIPDSAHALIQALHRSRHALDLVPARVAQQQQLLPDLRRLEVAHADGALAAADVAAADDGVFVGSRRDGDFDARVVLGERRQVRFEKSAGDEGQRVVRLERSKFMWAHVMPRLLPPRSQ